MAKNSYKVSLWVRKDDWVAQRMETGKSVELTYLGDTAIVKKTLSGSTEESLIPLTGKLNCSFKCLGKEKDDGKIVIYDVLEFNVRSLATDPYSKTIESLNLIEKELSLLGSTILTTSPIFKTESEKQDCQRKSKFNKWKGVFFKKINSIKSLNDNEIWWQQPFHFHGIVKKGNSNQKITYNKIF